MHASRFDMVVAGDSLAGRIAAALLVKHGKRLLLLSTPLCRDPWLHSSLFVEKLLGILGGRACFAPYEPFQVLSCRSRVTIHPELSLDDELAREFGHAATAVMALLAELESTGQLLEELLWEHGGLPTGGWREAASWHWLCLRRKLTLPALSRPLIEHCRNLPEAAAEWLRDLFQGLSLQPLETLTVADGALLWAYACRPESLAAKELDQLLHKRFEQFQGVEAGLETLSALEYRHGQWQGTLQGGSQFQAQHLILGDLSHEIGSHGLPLPPQLPAPNRQFLTSALDGRLSPLLEQRVIAGGALPMRMVVTATTAGLAGQIGSCSTAADVQVRRQLEPILPFVRYALDRHPHDRQHVNPTEAPDPCLPLFRLPLHLGNHLWCADETRLLPHLGIGGASLLAWTLVRNLDPSMVVRSS